MCVWDVIARRTHGLAEALAAAAVGVERDLAEERDEPWEPQGQCPGNASRYKRGCRCAGCRAANAARIRKYMRARRAAART